VRLPAVPARPPPRDADDPYLPQTA